MNSINPFLISPDAIDFKEFYPNSSLLKTVYLNTNYTERLGIIRLWMTEGIPYAFKSHPLLFEEIRNFIAKLLNVDTKEVSLVGSARIGYSLSKKEWGRPFNSDSDFDFIIVSNTLYGNIVKEFQNWVRDIETRKILPKDLYEMNTWLANIQYLDKQIPKGFIQTRFIPYNINYTTIKKCYDTIWLLKKRFVVTEIVPKVSDASIRVYSNWKSCVKQMHINFNTALDIW
jgi:hypothetical protein